MFADSEPIDRATTPIEEASSFLARLADQLGLDGVVDGSRLASARPTWPVWPQPALAHLIGPPPVVLEQIDLRWLHRFETAVSLLNELVVRVGGAAGGPSGLSLLVERAALLGHRGWGRWSAGTSCRLLRAADGWLAVNLARDEDFAAVPAWLDTEPGTESWEQVTSRLASRSRQELIDRAVLLGLAVCEVPAEDTPRRDVAALSISAHGVRASRPTKVVDLSSLWAGPLCGWYLARAGADVVKVESLRRPDGARRGTPVFYRRLNAPKRLVELDLSSGEGREALRRHIDEADIVIDAARPRAMEGFGVDPSEQVEAGTIWCSITGHGRHGAAGHRVAFGDDAAAGGGLITYADAEPWFIGDAAADPIAGVTAALGALSLWTTGRCGMVEVAMVDAVAALTDGTPVRSRA